MHIGFQRKTIIFITFIPGLTIFCQNVSEKCENCHQGCHLNQARGLTVALLPCLRLEVVVVVLRLPWVLAIPPGPVVRADLTVTGLDTFDLEEGQKNSELPVLLQVTVNCYTP